MTCSSTLTTPASRRRPIAIVLMGQPCSGKSTLAAKLVDGLPILYFTSSDRYIHQKEPWLHYDEKFSKYVNEAQKSLRKDINWFVGNKLDFVWDQTNLNFKYQFPKEYYKIAVIMPYVTWERTKQVNELRKGKTISYEVWDKFSDAYQLIDPTLIAEKFDEVIYAPKFQLEKKAG